MKRWLITLVLACLSLGVGAWAWQVGQARDNDLIFGASGEEAKEWAEKAKHDRWVELVTIEILDHEVVYVPVPNHKIDEQLKIDSNNIFRRWITKKEAASITQMLSSGGLSGMAEHTKDLANEEAAQKSNSTWLAVLSILLGLGAVATGIRTARQVTKPNNPPAEPVS